jgi:uncharacterized delta-60 repeat protein
VDIHALNLQEKGERKMRKVDQLILASLLVLGSAFARKSALAAAGSLDTTFGHGGVTVTTLTAASVNHTVVPYSVKLQSDGKILVLVNVTRGIRTTTEVLRYTTTGELDASFGSKGIAVLRTPLGEMESMALQPNGQIVVAGIGMSVAGFGVERLNTDGSVDRSFGADGLAVANLAGRLPGPELVVLIETSGDILLGGQLEPTGRRQPFQTVLVRFTSAGALDTTFGTLGTAIETAVGGCAALAEVSTGDILVEGAEFTSTGRLDSTVTGGTVVASAGSENPSVASVFLPNGDYLVADELFTGEESRAHNAAVQVLRFKADGTEDTTFANPHFHFAGTGGSGIEAVPNGIAVQSNGDIVVVGLQSTTTQSSSVPVNGLARLTSSGALDSTFGTNGTISNGVPSGTQGLEGIVIQPADGKIVAIGIANDFTELTVSRYLGE